MSYRIVVPVGGDLEANLATVDSLVAHVAAPERIVLVGERNALRTLQQRRPRLPGRAQEVPDPPRTEGRLAELLETVPDGDLLVVSPGVLAVPLLDLRLAWSVRSTPGIAGVSPLSFGDPLTARARRALLDADPVRVDATLSAAPPTPLVDAPDLLPACFYLCRAALADLEPAASSDLGELCAVLKRRGQVLARALHVYVGGSASRDDGLAPAEEPGRASPASQPLQGQLARLLRQPLLATPAAEGLVRRKARPRILHVTHSLGGGLNRWVEQFSATGYGSEDWILRSMGERGRFGSQLWLFDSPYATRPRRTWWMAEPIAATAVHHVAYREAFEEILSDLGIEAVIVSSLIGHSLVALRSGLPTAFVCHDYYPFCPALHIHYEGVCTSCTPQRLGQCRHENPVGDIFPERQADGWLSLRDAFLDALHGEEVRIVAPSDSVRRNYRQLAPDLAHVPFTVIEHAATDDALVTLRERLAARGREGEGARREGALRVVVLGRLSPVKGRQLFLDVAAQMSDEVSFHLVGCGASWATDLPSGVEVIPDYEERELAEILARIDPDLTLFLSIVPETFSFTLSECFAAGVPPLATRVGSFEDRISDGVSGFLVEPSAAAVVDRLRGLARHRGELSRVRRALAERPRRRNEEMFRDYAELLGLPDRSPRAYFSRVAGSAADPGPPQPGVDESWLPPSSPLGFADFLLQVERGTRHHIRVSPRLRPWQRRLVGALADTIFGLVRWTLRRL